MPIFQSATFDASGLASYHDARYIRLNNTPNHLALHTKLAQLEGGEAAVVTASGMAAISTTLLTVLATGDRVLAQRGVYGGTHGFLTQECASLGIGVDWIDGSDRESWEHACGERTRAIFVEAMTNPLLEVADLEGVVAFARAHGLVSIIDSTFATPVNFRPLELGFDLVLHSCTKYMNGHDDIVAGVVIGSAQWVQRITHRLNHFGGSLDPHAAFLLHRGLKTLAVRVRHQNASGQRVAEYLHAHPAVERVYYAGLPSHPSYARARALFEGCAGTLSFDLVGGARAAQSFIARLRLATQAPSLGGVETLIMIPALISHAALAPEERRALGISDGLIRLSLGLESADDLIADLDHALQPLASARGA
jgi:cystathionine beta-lyase/cystathionine gamma-synthase